MARILLTLGLLTLAVWPYLAWACLPSLFDDDVTRVGDFRRSTFPGSLFRPFNEHVAPLFEVVGWLAWWGSGRQVELIASRFLVASYVAWFATLVMLGLMVRLETRSGMAALVGVALFATSPVAAETVLWYSASSFQWAAAASLAAWFAAIKATRADSPSWRLSWLGMTAGCAAVSPLFSAIGVLAGPLASLRIWAAAEQGSPMGRLIWGGRSRLAAASVPLLGTVVYGLIVWVNPVGGGAVAATVRQHLDPLAALWACLRAPTAVLAPGVLGWSPRPEWLPGWVAAASTLILGGGAIAWSVRDRDHRPLIIVGLGWIGAGYLLAYAARAQPNDQWILEVGRYHLFPLIGIAAGAGAWVGPRLDRLATRSPTIARGLLGGLILLAALQGRVGIDAVARRTFRFPDQRTMVAATLRLETICRARGISLEQAIRIIDPVEPRWFPRPLPFHPALYLFGLLPPGDRMPDAQARTAALGDLDADDREALFGGLDVDRMRDSAPTAAGGLPASRLAPAVAGEATPIGVGRIYYYEFALPAGMGDPTSIDLVGITPGVRIEVWWADAESTWTTGRSVRWTTGSEPERPLELARLPHWRADFVRRFRVVRRGWPLAAADRPNLVVRSSSD